MNIFTPIRYFVILIIFFGVFIRKFSLFFLLLSCSRNNFDSFLKENKTKLDFNSTFQVKTKSSVPLFVLGENISKEQLLKINIKHVKDNNKALDEIKKSIFLIVSQYEFTMAPYPGQITVATNCGTALHPKLNYKNNVYYISSFANERLALSICQGDEYSLIVSTAYFYEPSTNLLLSVDFYQKKNIFNTDPSIFFKDHFKEINNINLSRFKNLF
ncbi:MAG: hypothetical protein H7281_04490 [Bacteriovorax sp.]|nr:hypothetical protein [Bacteriovorax sp.]